MAGETDVMRFVGLDEFINAVTSRVTEADASSRRVVVEMAAVFVTQAKINASGPARISTTERAGSRVGFATLAHGEGGPGVVTGHNRASIHATLPYRWGMGWAIDAGPSMVYSRRLELGFVGTDSLGRTYNQPPYPFVAPALNLVRILAPMIAKRVWGGI